MRFSQVIAISLTAVLLFVTACFGVDRVLIAGQKSDYSAGHAAYLRGECDAALPDLAKAQFGWHDQELARRAGPERVGCQQLESVRATVEKTSPAKGVATYVDYLTDAPAAPLAEAARREARGLLTSAPMEQIASAQLCDLRSEMSDQKVLRVSAKDSLAAPYLAACGAVREKAGDQEEALRLYDQLHERFPDSKQARDGVDDLGRFRVRYATKIASNRLPSALPYEGDSSLGGSARVIMQNSSPSALKMTVSGAKKTRLVDIPSCKGCRNVTSIASERCPNSGPKVSVVVPAGKYSAISTYGGSVTKGSALGKWTLEGGSVYLFCFWNILPRDPGVDA